MQILRKENEAIKSQEKNYHNFQDERGDKIRAVEFRVSELQSKCDDLIKENDSLKARIKEIGNNDIDKSFRFTDYLGNDNNSQVNLQLKYDNEKLKSELQSLITSKDELIRINENMKIQIESGQLSNNSFLGGNQRTDINLQDHKIKSLQKLLEDSCSINEKNLKEIAQIKKENYELRNEIELLRKTGDFNKNPYSPNKLNDTSFMLNRTITYELEAENESLKHKLTSLEYMISDYKTKYAILQGENDSLKKDGGNDPNKKLRFSQEASTESEVYKSRLATNELLLNDYKLKLDQSYKEIGNLRNENALLLAEIEELNKIKGKGLNSSNQEILNRSFRDTSLNRTFQLELEMENESLKKNLNSLENMLQDYKMNVRTSNEKNQNMEKINNDLIKENQDLKTRLQKSGNVNVDNSKASENANLMNKIEELKKESKDNGLLFDNLSKTNQRLMAENNKLMEMLRKSQDEMDGLKSRSRIMDASLFGGDDIMTLREKVAELQRENEIVTTEKDKLLVELSKLMAQQF